MNKELFLDALESAGVDNWEGYSIAQDIYEAELKGQAIENEFSDIINNLLLDVSVTSEEDPHLPSFYYEGNIKDLYNTIKNFVYKVEKENNDDKS